MSNVVGCTHVLVDDVLLILTMLYVTHGVFAVSSYATMEMLAFRLMHNT